MVSSVRFVTAVLSLLLIMGPVSTSANTPSVVFQIVEQIDAELAELHKNNYTQPSPARQEKAIRAPRHVYELALTLNQRVQTLRYINGLQPRPVTSLPVRVIKPSDVAQLVTQVLADIRELRAVYGVTTEIAEPAVVAGKTPTDVFNKLLKVEASLIGLGLPAILPNDVAQAAETLLGDLRLIEKNAGIPAAPPRELVPGKTPQDAYNVGYSLLEQLASYADRINLPGGITLPTRKSGNISPGDVLFLLTATSAEVGALKAHKVVTSPTTVAPLRGGRTPSDVWATITEAQAVINGLIASTG